ncbi:MAG: cobalt transporter [Stygiobacter sp. RIFOXYC12_FULL_38_8]|nr:MAG: cobalt transporter [Stygiobacter sp. GWC2_38_9]OGU83199.1 MAG: cobalt transporter [Stygiobacter sp. RIFOXYA12_FULL_38_9]OGV07662.1 MAG: cobalt transporter [Stygiobacter sp. RIFOXYB2_FULL_37_11]OGV10824.1 MAG: cobalt transporter [Stygiobacter sp. RIFOXYA2_FULL_38_8]OGV12665.1 MAG: cobalt transporter [Stygiobacter sp. RIFOXYC2_FULL_38_25]OGV26923.1 MAG: cobalt transporter [Stygiobacter sp. RIFOXYC12_FULL_38_8]OGV82078.1 MAG: cobalt transporter [Stygiobacter sp. GWF2_38_21]OGV90219.1 MA
MALNFVITIVQIIGGIFSNSLALISDALHNLSDGVSIIISYFAIQLKKKDSSYKHTFGLKRAEILAAVINASALIVIYAFLFYEAVKRFMNPEEIEPLTMSIVAAIGLVANIIGTLLLKRDSKDSLNIRSAYMHLLSDSVSSVAVIFGAIAIALWKINWIDPVLTLLIGIYIVRESYVILSEAIHVLMEGTPPQIDVEKIQEEVEKFSEVDDIHHVHVWMVGENDVHLEAHVNITDMKISESNELRARIEKTLDDKFGIHHVTLQFECNQCPDVGLLGKHK